MGEFKSRRIRMAATALAVASLLIPMLFFTGVEASASTSVGCEVGILQGDLCVVDYGPASCPDDTTSDGLLCVTVTPPEIVNSCPAGSSGEPGGCYIVVARGPGQIECAEGTLVGELCELVAEPLTTCPDGFVVDPALNGLCTRTEPAELAAATCPAGAQGVAGGCYIIVARGPRGPLTCSEGTLIGDNCVIVGDPPVSGPPTCPVSATVFFVDGRCFVLIEAQADGSCPDGTIPAADGVNCERSVMLRPGPLMCATGFGLVNGECIRFEAPISTPPECPVGSVEDNNGDCRRPVGDAPPTYFCADPLAALNGQVCVFTAGFVQECPAGFELADAQCVRYSLPIISPPGCPVGSLEAENGECRKPVADVVTASCTEGVLTAEGCEVTIPAECQSGTLNGGVCLDEFPAIFLCNGEVPTINMMTGDSGQGTPGRDVILGTSGADLIAGRGGDDVICGQGGDDLIWGGIGADAIFGEGGNDRISGGSGNDVLVGESGDDRIWGRGGDDYIFGGDGEDRIWGDNGADRIFGQIGDDTVWAGRGNDFVSGGAGDDDLRGNRGADEIYGGDDNDSLRGGQGTDALFGEAGDDTLRGDQGSDALDGGADVDTCRGGSGQDTAVACESTKQI